MPEISPAQRRVLELIGDKSMYVYQDFWNHWNYVIVGDRECDKQEGKEAEWLAEIGLLQYTPYSPTKGRYTLTDAGRKALEERGG